MGPAMVDTWNADEFQVTPFGKTLRGRMSGRKD
jgi:hypothetical protein